MRRVALVALGAALAAAGCGGATAPAMLDTRAGITCASCRMSVADTRTAAQVVAPVDEPLFFDDLGCLREFRTRQAVKPGAVTYVADHRTGGWVPADAAVYARAEGVETPMGSHVLAWTSAASRDADPDARGAAPLDRAAAIGEGARP